MYKPEEKPLNPTPEPGNAWERIKAREAALEARIAALKDEKDNEINYLKGWIDTLNERLGTAEGLIDELMQAMERARIPRYPGL